MKGPGIKPCVLLAGNFAAGKTSLVNAREHKGFDAYSTQVDGWISPGGEKGGDAIAGKGLATKSAVYDYFAGLVHHPILLHAKIYQNKLDIDRLATTHDLHLVLLKTDIKTLIYRFALRKHKQPEVAMVRTWQDVEHQLEVLYSYANFRKIPVHRIDNNQDFKTTSAAVWGLLDKLKGDLVHVAGKDIN